MHFAFFTCYYLYSGHNLALCMLNGKAFNLLSILNLLASPSFQIFISAGFLYIDNKVQEETMAAADAHYVCSLDPASVKKAQQELNEDPKNRLGAVQTFREWILQQKHIKCPTGMM